VETPISSPQLRSTPCQPIWVPSNTIAVKSAPETAPARTTAHWLALPPVVSASRAITSATDRETLIRTDLPPPPRDRVVLLQRFII
jgi:hypothetical protein